MVRCPLVVLRTSSSGPPSQPPRPPPSRLLFMLLHERGTNLQRAGPMIHQLTLFLQWKQTISPVCWFLVRPEKTVIYKTKQKVSASVLHSVWFNLRPQTLWVDVKRWILYLSGRFLLGQALWFDPDANGVCLRSSRAVRDDVHPPPLWFIWHTHFFSPFSFP